MQQIVFGLSRHQDEQALATLMQRFSKEPLLQTLVARMDEEEMEALFNLLSSLMRKHLSHEEYHRFFLDQN